MIAAVWILLLRDGRVLLSRRRATGYRDGWLSLVGGHLEDDESVRRGAVREAREEVGVDVTPGSVDVVSVVHRQADGSRVDFFTACRDWTGEPFNAEPGKCSELVWSPVRELPADVVPYMRTAVANYRAGVWFESLDWPESPPQPH
ncbi:NUDIX domain-containing protein [Streptomyces sp. NPDC050617]|uniref:NUDIX hydrolase n=1 Tax=Streptomyces sp. NPDC050617 TaxID=3154628 RepID=UPI003445FFDA